MKVYLDIETIPCQSEEIKNKWREELGDGFKAPSSLTKESIGKDLKLTAEDVKSLTKPQLVAMWEEVYKERWIEEELDKKLRSTSLDGSLGEIISITYICEERILSYFRRLGESESDLIAKFYESLSEVLKRKDYGSLATPTSPYWVGHNIRFDLKFLYQRSVVLGIKPPVKLPFSGRHGSDFHCTSEAWEGYGKRISQDNLCVALGLPTKGDITGANVWDYVLAGKEDEVNKYNQEDVRTVVEIYKKQEFL